MNIIKRKVLKILKNKNIIYIILVVVLIIGLLLLLKHESNFITLPFYYVNYDKKIDYEYQSVPKSYNFDKLFYYYFSGGRNRKKFPLYFIDSKFINNYYIKNKTLCISLNDSGYEEFKKIPEDIKNKICEAILMTFNKSKKISLDNLSIIYNTYMELYNFSLKK